MLIRSLKKSPEVVLIWLKEQDGAEEAGRSDVVACRPVWFVETALNPTNLPQEPNGHRAEGEVTRGARSGDHRVALQGGGVPAMQEQEQGSPLHTGSSGVSPHACPAPSPSHPLPVCPLAQADGNFPVEVHLRPDPDDARAMTGPAGVAPRGNQPWSSHQGKPLRSGKRRRKRKWQRQKEAQNSTEDQSARFLPAAIQVRRARQGTRGGGSTAGRTGNALCKQRHGVQSSRVVQDWSQTASVHTPVLLLIGCKTSGSCTSSFCKTDGACGGCGQGVLWELNELAFVMRVVSIIPTATAQGIRSQSTLTTHWKGRLYL